MFYKNIIKFNNYLQSQLENNTKISKMQNLQHQKNLCIHDTLSWLLDGADEFNSAILR